MKLLIDTNVVLEMLLWQQQADESIELFNRLGEHDFYITDFSLHSLGVILFQKNRREAFVQFLKDMIVNPVIEIKTLLMEDMDELTMNSRSFNLDFDDAYQYTTAIKFGLTIVSFDNDFDRTELGRKEPGEI